MYLEITPQLLHTKHSICIRYVQWWTNVEDFGPTLYKCYKDVLCLMGSPVYIVVYRRLFVVQTTEFEGEISIQLSRLSYVLIQIEHI